MMVTETMLASMETCKEVCIQCQTICIDTLNYCKSSGDNIDMTLMCMMRDCAEMCMMCVNMIMDGSEFTGRTSELCAQMCDRVVSHIEYHQAMDRDDKMMTTANICRQCAEQCNLVAKQSASYFRRPNSLTLADVTA
jgi:hypothetical protein